MSRPSCAKFPRTGFDTTLPRFDVMAALYRIEQGSR
jgi:hypothetical protein